MKFVDFKLAAAVLTIFCIPLHSLGVELTKDTQSMIFSERNRTGIGRGADLESPRSVVVKVMKNGTIVGQHEVKDMSFVEAMTMESNIRALQLYINEGGKLKIDATPTPEQISVAVQSILNSRNSSEVKRMYQALLKQAQTEASEWMELYRECNDNARRTRRRIPDDRPAKGISSDQ